MIYFYILFLGLSLLLVSCGSNSSTSGLESPGQKGGISIAEILSQGESRTIGNYTYQLSTRNISVDHPFYFGISSLDPEMGGTYKLIFQDSSGLPIRLLYNQSILSASITRPFVGSSTGELILSEREYLSDSVTLSIQIFSSTTNILVSSMSYTLHVVSK